MAHLITGAPDQPRDCSTAVSHWLVLLDGNRSVLQIP